MPSIQTSLIALLTIPTVFAGLLASPSQPLWKNETSTGSNISGSHNSSIIHEKLEQLDILRALIEEGEIVSTTNATSDVEIDETEDHTLDSFNVTSLGEDLKEIKKLKEQIDQLEGLSSNRFNSTKTRSTQDEQTEPDDTVMLTFSDLEELAGSDSIAPLTCAISFTEDGIAKRGVRNGHADCNRRCGPSAFCDIDLPDFDPFNDLDEKDTSVFQDRAAMHRFFEFTEANLENSRVNDWYALWTQVHVRTNRAEWDDRGEWSLFMKKFANAVDFTCFFKSSCQVPTLEMLVDLYPHNPELVRRIYFVSKRYVLWHDMFGRVDDIYAQVQPWIVNHIPALVSIFTYTPNAQRVKRCELTKQLVQMAVQFTISATGALSSGLMTPALQAVSEGYSSFLKVALDPVINGKTKHFEFDFKDLIIGEAWSAISNAWSYKEQHDRRMGRNQIDFAGGLDAGKDTEALCSSFAGGQEIDLQGNIEKIRSKLAELFDQNRNRNRELFEQLYWGENSGNGISITAAAFMRIKWQGHDSVISKLTDGSPWITELKKQTALRIASAVGRSNLQYLVCTENHPGGMKCGHPGVICPRPNLVCHARKWYHANINSKPMDAPWIDGAAGVFASMDIPLTSEVMLQSAWDFYERHGNNLDENDAETWSAGSGRMVPHASYAMPVCVADQFNADLIGVHLGNVEKMAAYFGRGSKRSRFPYWHQETFPTACGRDYRSSEVRPFMNALRLGMGSGIYDSRYLSISNELYGKRMVEALIVRESSPISHFLAMCEVGVRRTNKSEFKGISITPSQKYNLHNGEDRSCQHVEQRTKHMNIHDADNWFCNSNNHNVFNDEIDTRFEMESSGPSHKTLCEERAKNLAGRPR